MIAADPLSFPELPPTEVEWEELLLRIEIGPRALAVAMEDRVPGERGGAALREALIAESGLQRALEAMSEGAEVAAAPDGDDAVAPAPDEALDALRRLRARSFAMVQRRGLGVWGWRQRGGATAGATAYQLLRAAAARDGALLATLREGR
jgi:hypothetical protein